MFCAIFTFGLDGASHSSCWVAIRKSGGPVAWNESASVRVVGESIGVASCLQLVPSVIRWP